MRVALARRPQTYLSGLHVALLIPLASSSFLEWNEDELGSVKFVGKVKIRRPRLRYYTTDRPMASQRHEDKRCEKSSFVDVLASDGDFSVDTGLEILGLRADLVQRVMEAAEDPTENKLDPATIARIRTAMRERINREVVDLFKSRVHRLATEIILAGVEMLPSSSSSQSSGSKENIFRRQIDWLAKLMLSPVLLAHSPVVNKTIKERSRLFTNNPDDHLRYHIRIHEEAVDTLKAFIDSERLRLYMGVEPNATHIPGSPIFLARIDEFLKANADIDVFDVPVLEQVVWHKLFPKNVLTTLRRAFEIEEFPEVLRASTSESDITDDSDSEQKAEEEAK